MNIIPFTQAEIKFIQEALNNLLKVRTGTDPVKVVERIMIKMAAHSR